MKYNIILLLVVLKSNLCNSQVTFNSTYDTGGYETIFNILPLTNNYWVALNLNNFPQQYQLKKVDSFGISIISKTYIDSIRNIIIYSLIQSNDSNMIIGSYSRNYLNNSRNVFLAKLNLNGDTLWSNAIPPPLGMCFYGQYLIETTDHGFLISGEITDSLISDGDFFILKTDNLGNFLWMNTFGGGNFDCAFSSIETFDKGFLTLGWTRSFGFGNANNRDIYLVKSDSLGIFQWQKTYGDINQQSGVGISQTMDGNFLIATGWYDINNTISYGELIKIDVDGDVIWDKLYGGGKANGFWWSREQGNYDIVSVSAYTNTNGFDDGWVLRSDSSGNEKWQRRYRVGNSHCYFRDVQETPDGGIICAGFVFDGASGGQDGWLVKLDSTGCLAAGNCGEPIGLFEASSSSQYRMIVSPNPITTQAVVKLDGLSQQLLNASYNVQVIDISGRLVQSPQTGFLIGDDWLQFIFRPENLTSGVYFLGVSTTEGERIGVAKVFVE